MAKLEFRFFGSPSLSVDGEIVRLGRRKAVALVAFLTTTGKRHSRERLADIFWPEHDLQRARASLRRTLSVITTTLGKWWLSIDHDSIGYAPHASLQVDVNRFRELTTGEDLSTAPMEALGEAANLYGNDFMAGFSLDDCPDFDDWHYGQTEKFRREGARVLEQLSRLSMQKGDCASAIRHTSAWIDLAPLHEAAHRQLIRLHHQEGNTGDAMLQYSRCREILEKELGVQPSEQTSTLATHIRTDAMPAQPSPPAAPHLPVQSTRFIGRERELATLLTQLTTTEVRLVTLTGPGGMGKTRLALEAATRIATTSTLTSYFPQGVFFLSAENTFSVEAVITALSTVLNHCPDKESSSELQLLAFLASRKLLLVLDNLEHLPEIGTMISRLLSHAPGITVLATSRARLQLKGEHVFPLSGLSIPSTSSHIGNAMTETIFDAIELFLHSAQMVQPERVFDEADLHGIMRICHLTRGMPLALILAAGWLELFSPEMIADEIVKNLDFLASPLRDIPPAHQSMRAVFDSSWNHLPEAERTLLSKLSIFRDGFTISAAITVTNLAGIPSLMANLVKKSMLQTGSESGRFEMHPLLRQYGREKLDQLDPASNVAAAHADYYLNRVHEAAHQLIGTGMIECRKALDADLPNACQAWEWSIEQGNVSLLVHAALGFYVYFDMHTRYREGEDLFRPARDRILKTCDTNMGPDAVLILLCWFDMHTQSVMMRSHPRPHEKIPRQMLAATRNLLRAAAKHRNDKARAFTLLLLGIMAHAEHRYDRAVRLFRLSMQQHPGVEHAFWVYIRLGMCWQSIGHMPHAVDNFLKSREAGNQLGDAIKQAWSLNSLGAARMGMGDLETAESNFRSAATIFEKIHAPIGMLSSFEEQAWAALLKGDPSRALRRSKHALSIAASRCPASSVHQSILSLKGLAHIVANDSVRGEACLEEVLGMCTSNMTAHLAMVFSGFIRGEQTMAEYHLDMALQSVPFAPPVPQRFFLLLASAVVHDMAGEPVECCRLLSSAIHHPCAHPGLFESWELPRSLNNRLKQTMRQEQYAEAWEQGASTHASDQERTSVQPFPSA